MAYADPCCVVSLPYPEVPLDPALFCQIHNPVFGPWEFYIPIYHHSSLSFFQNSIPLESKNVFLSVQQPRSLCILTMLRNRTSNFTSILKMRKLELSILCNFLNVM